MSGFFFAYWWYLIAQEMEYGVASHAALLAAVLQAGKWSRLAAITAVYSGWFSTRVSCLCCGVCTEMSPLYLWISRIWRLIRSGK